jgi:hypothetical protein
LREGVWKVFVETRILFHRDQAHLVDPYLGPSVGKIRRGVGRKRDNLIVTTPLAVDREIEERREMSPEPKIHELRLSPLDLAPFSAFDFCHGLLGAICGLCGPKRLQRAADFVYSHAS